MGAGGVGAGARGLFLAEREPAPDGLPCAGGGGGGEDPGGIKAHAPANRLGTGAPDFEERHAGVFEGEFAAGGGHPGPECLVALGQGAEVGGIAELRDDFVVGHAEMNFRVACRVA